MGLLKKIFKPVSKVLDKIVPNEIKPFLPYAAAFAPFIAPGIMGTSVMQRALMGGGMNIFGQLAQEGNEGDINLLSAGLGALSGAMTAPGGTTADFSAAGPMEGPALTKTPGFQDYMQRGIDKYGAESAIGEIAKAGIKSADFMQAPGLMKYGIPAAQATGDLMFAQAKRDQDDYDRMMEEESEAEGASNAQRAAAIRQSMESYGFTEEEIEDAIYAAGYKAGGRVGLMEGGLGALGGAMKKEPEIFSLDGSDIQILMPDNNPTIIGEGTQGGEKVLLIEINGNTQVISEDAFYDKFGESKAKGGRVGLRFGGIGDAVENIEDAEIKESAKFAMNDMDIPIMDLVEEFEIQFKRKPNSIEELKQFYKDRYEYKGPGDNVKMKEKIKEKIVMEAKDGGLMNLGGKEMDLRGGGFVPIGKKEKADDVPARLSKNEFVMTADAVRAAGGGSVNEGAKRMYETMNRLEAKV